MKKIIAWILMAILLLSLCACRPQNDKKDETKEPADTQQMQPDAGDSDDQKDNTADPLTVDEVMAAPETSADEFDYDVTDDGVEITDYNGDGGIVVVPKKIEGVDVVWISKKAFMNANTITAVKLPDTVEEVGNEAFQNCGALEIFISGNGVKRLGEYAFNACVKLNTAILSDVLEVIDDLCFARTALTEVELPGTVKEISYAFEGKSLEEPFTIIGEAGSFVEQYVQEYGENCKLVFRAK